MRSVNYNQKLVVQQIQALKGEKVELSINKGRKKIETFFAVIQTLYPRIFTVSLNDSNENATKTYSYSEVMCGDVVIKPVQKTDA